MYIISMMYIIIAILDSLIMLKVYNSVLTLRIDYYRRWIPFIISLSALPLKIMLQSINPLASLDILFQSTGIILAGFIAIYFYKDSLKRKLLTIFLLYAVIAISELLLILLLMVTLSVPLEELKLNSPICLIGVLLIKVITIIILDQLPHRSVKYIEVNFSYTKELLIILLSNVMFFILVLYAINDPTMLINNIEIYTYILLGCLVLISFLSCFLIIKIAKKSRLELETQLKMQQMEMEMKLNDDMYTMIDKLRSLRHNMNNHIGIMLGLIRTNQHDELTSYLSALYDDIEQSNDIIFHPNKALMVLLNNKLTKASSLDIDLELAIQAKDLPLSDKDISILLGNILDNAIEAASKCTDDRFIRFVLKQKGSQFLILCENTFVTPPTVKNGAFVTTKKDASIHGIGLKNIKTIVNTYHGVLDISYNDVFQVNIVLNV